MDGALVTIADIVGLTAKITRYGDQGPYRASVRADCAGLACPM
jgi:hypothetical protein